MNPYDTSPYKPPENRRQLIAFFTSNTTVEVFDSRGKRTVLAGGKAVKLATLIKPTGIIITPASTDEPEALWIYPPRRVRVSLQKNHLPMLEQCLT